MSNPFPAKFGGRCGYGDTIHEGDQVRYDNDGELVHTACEDNPPPTEDTPRRNERKCPDCYTIHAGECA
jgi:hypothetical protein